MTQAIINYELLWQCKITLAILLDGSDGAQWLMVEGMAEPRADCNLGLLHSVYVSSTMRGLNATTLSAAMLHLLHKLDREIEVAKPMAA